MDTVANLTQLPGYEDYPGYSVVQCYFPALPRNSSCAGLGGDPGSREPAAAVADGEWGLFYVSQPVEQRDWDADAVAEGMEMASITAVAVLLVLAVLESRRRLCSCCTYVGFPTPLNLTNYASPYGKFMSVATVMGMSVLREALDHAKGIDTPFGYDRLVSLQCILIFAALMAPETNSSELGGAAVGLGFAALCSYVMMDTLINVATHPDRDPDLPTYKTMDWTVTMAYWSMLAGVLGFMTIWYLLRSVYAVRTALGPKRSRLELLPQSQRGSDSLTSAALAFNDTHVRVLLARFAGLPSMGHSPRATNSDDDDDVSLLVIGDQPTAADSRGKRRTAAVKQQEKKKNMDEQLCSEMCGGCRDVCSGDGSTSAAIWRCIRAPIRYAWGLCRCCCCCCCCCCGGGKKPSALTISQAKTFRYSTRIMAAVAASVAFIAVACTKALHVVRVYFAHGILECALYVKLGVENGLGTDLCVELGPCGTFVRENLLRFGLFTQPGQIYVGFPCEQTPMDVGGRPRSWLLCKTADLIVNIAAWSLSAAVIIGTLIQLLMLRNMLQNHRTSLLALRRGDWSAVPPQLRRMSAGYAMSNLTYFVVFVWLQSSIGLILFMVLTVSTVLVLTVPILTIVPLFYPVDIIPDSARQLLWSWMASTVYTYLLYPAVLIMTNYAFVVVRYTAGSGHQVVTRNRGSWFWYETATIIFFIPLIITKFTSRFIKAVFSVMVYMSRVDVSLMVRGSEHRDPAFVSYIAFLLNDHAVTNPTLMCFCRILMSGQKRRQELLSAGGNRQQQQSIQAEHDSDNEALLPLDDDPGAGSSVISNVARNRWWLALTLTRNPGLVRCRAQHLESGGPSKSHLSRSVDRVLSSGKRGAAILRNTLSRPSSSVASLPENPAAAEDDDAGSQDGSGSGSGSGEESSDEEPPPSPPPPPPPPLVADEGAAHSDVAANLTELRAAIKAYDDEFIERNGREPSPKDRAPIGGLVAQYKALRETRRASQPHK